MTHFVFGRPFGRIGAIALNTFREAARDRVPLGLFGAGLGVALASLLVAAMSLGRDRSEVVAVLTTASVSLFALIGAIVLGASLLYKDLERKTIFPILARPVHRHEIVVGKHLGLVATVATFSCLDGALALTITAFAREDGSGSKALFAWLFCGVALFVVLFRSRDKSTPFLVFAPLVLAMVASVIGPLGDLRTFVLVTSMLAVVEAAIVAAVAMVFGSFSTPFLTAALTVGVVLIGRNTDLLARLPERTFGTFIVGFGKFLARVVPNLHLFVPPRPVATGRAGVSALTYLGESSLYGILYIGVLLLISSLIFQRRDFA